MAAPVETLRKVPLFADLERKELQQVAGSMKERTFAAGETVTREGQGGVGFFVIEDGEAEVTVRGERRATLKAGDYFGEVALLGENARSATITATSPLHCYGMTFWDFRPLVENSQTIAWKLLQAMAKQLQAASSE